MEGTFDHDSFAAFLRATPGVAVLWLCLTVGRIGFSIVFEHKWRMAVAPLHERFRRRTTYRFRVEFQRADGCED